MLLVSIVDGPPALFIKTGAFKRTEEKRYKETGCCSESCMADYQTVECLLLIAFV